MFDQQLLLFSLNTTLYVSPLKLALDRVIEKAGPRAGPRIPKQNVAKYSTEPIDKKKQKTSPWSFVHHWHTVPARLQENGDRAQAQSFWRVES